MVKFLVLFVLVLAVLWFLRRQRQGASEVERRDKSSLETPKVGEMVRCAHCGVCFPQREAFVLGDSFFCSEQHRHLKGGFDE